MGGQQGRVARPASEFPCLSLRLCRLRLLVLRCVPPTARYGIGLCAHARRGAQVGGSSAPHRQAGGRQHVCRDGRRRERGLISPDERRQRERCSAAEAVSGRRWRRRPSCMGVLCGLSKCTINTMDVGTCRVHGSLPSVLPARTLAAPAVRVLVLVCRCSGLAPGCRTT